MQTLSRPFLLKDIVDAEILKDELSHDKEEEIKNVRIERQFCRFP